MVWDRACVPSAPPTRYEQGERAIELNSLTWFARAPGSQPVQRLNRCERNSVTRFRAGGEGLYSDAVIGFGIRIGPHLPLCRTLSGTGCL